MHLVWVEPQLWRDVYFPENDESLPKPFSFILCGLFWPPPLWVKTKSGSPSCHRTDYFFHFEGRFCHLHCIFHALFLTCYYGRLCTFHKWVHRVKQHLEQSCFTSFKSMYYFLKTFLFKKIHKNVYLYGNKYLGSCAFGYILIMNTIKEKQYF